MRPIDAASSLLIVNTLIECFEEAIALDTQC